MRAVVQRVTRASVRVEGDVVGSIDQGLMILLGVEQGDGGADAQVLAKKIASLRLFRGDRPMDRSLEDVQGSVLVVSQFTLAGSVRKGRRPSFDKAEEPHAANALYQSFCECLRTLGVPVQTGEFGANMQVSLVNDGPITLIIDAREGALV